MTKQINAASPPHFDLKDIALEERIGRGNFPVFKATMGGKAIAVKKMDCDKNEIPREVMVQTKISSHPNVLPLLGIAHSSDGFSIYICMKLADTSLYHIIHKEMKKPSLQQSSKWALQIARGMHHIHQHGFAHRDLKSANILLFEKEGVVKICDFGTARPLENTTSMTGMIGTCRWMAPEFNDKATTKVNQRCDVFSYGMVLFEIFAHELPFAECDESEVHSRICNEKRPTVPSELPSYLHKLMESCWKHKPHDRPTFGELLQTLDFGPQLHQAAGSGNLFTVQGLIEEGTDVNLRNEDGKTALHLAAARGHPDVVQVLTAAHADLNLQDKNGHTAMDIARAQGHKEIADLLNQYSHTN